jgi:hypothetical protein
MTGCSIGQVGIPQQHQELAVQSFPPPLKRAAEASKAVAVNAVEVIDVSDHKPRRIPSAKWRELIKKVWEADPLMCPRCSHEMRIVALIDERAIIERILRHLGL